MEKITDENISKIFKLLEKIICVRVLKRIFCVLLLSCEIDNNIISEKLGLSVKSIKKYENILHFGNLSDLIPNNDNRRKSELEGFKTVIFEELDKNSYKTLREICVMIERLTGLKRSRGTVGRFLKKTGFVLSK